MGPDDSFSPIPGIAFSVSREKAVRVVRMKIGGGENEGYYESNQCIA